MSDDNLKHLDAQKLTWAVLLGKWVEFARSAVALPNDEQGNKLRESVPDLIMLQAVWFALQHMDELTANEQALGLDRAGVLIDQHEKHLLDTWSAQTLPEKMSVIVREARQMLNQQTDAFAPASLHAEDHDEQQS